MPNGIGKIPGEAREKSLKIGALKELSALRANSQAVIILFFRRGDPCDRPD